jgi:hypothetical protein
MYKVLDLVIATTLLIVGTYYFLHSGIDMCLLFLFLTIRKLTRSNAEGDINE